MREIVLDTETTGFDPETGDRIVEIGAVELSGHVATGKTYHQYINPERSMPQEAFEVHGLGDDFLRDKPKFAAIGQLHESQAPAGWKNHVYNTNPITCGCELHAGII